VLTFWEEGRKESLTKFRDFITELSDSLTSCTVSSELSHDYSFPGMPISELFFGSIICDIPFVLYRENNLDSKGGSQPRGSFPVKGCRSELRTKLR
jgi:hypothetical protein